MQIIRINILIICCILLTWFLKRVDAEFIMHNLYILMLTISFAIMAVVEIIFLIIKKNIQNNKKIFVVFRYSIFIILCVSIVSSYFLNKEEVINDDNANSYIHSLPNMEGFIEDETAIVNTDGSAYKTIFTNEWYHYLTGTPFDKNENRISGLKVNYIYFRDNFISGFLLDKYYTQLKDVYKFEEKYGVDYYEENILNEKQIYILAKNDNKIIFIKVFSRANIDSYDVINKIFEKLNLKTDYSTNKNT